MSGRSFGVQSLREKWPLRLMVRVACRGRRCCCRSCRESKPKIIVAQSVFKSFSPGNALFQSGTRQQFFAAGHALASRESLRLFCYLFDSAKARQTVRWGRFRGLLFAPEERAKRGKPDACLAVDGPLAPQTGHRLGALLGRSRRAHRLGSQPGQTAKRQTARAGATKPRHARLSLPPALRKLSPVSLPL